MKTNYFWRAFGNQIAWCKAEWPPADYLAVENLPRPKEQKRPWDMNGKQSPSVKTDIATFVSDVHAAVYAHQEGNGGSIYVFGAHVINSRVK